MKNRKINEPFPSIWQCFLYFGILIVISLPLSIINAILKNYLSEKLSKLIMYVLMMAGSFLVFNKIRYEISGDGKFYFYKPTINLLILILITSIIYILRILSLISDLVPISEKSKLLLLSTGIDNPVLGFIVVVGFAPVFEELIFRGIMLDGLLQKYSPFASIVMSSFLFSIVHMIPRQMISAFLAGLFIGWLYFKTRNILIPILIHAFNNLLSFLWKSVVASTYKQQSIQELYGGIPNYILLLIASILVFFIFIHLLNKSLERNGVFVWERLKQINSQEVK